MRRRTLSIITILFFSIIIHSTVFSVGKNPENGADNNSQIDDQNASQSSQSWWGFDLSSLGLDKTRAACIAIGARAAYELIPREVKDGCTNFMKKYPVATVCTAAVGYASLTAVQHLVNNMDPVNMYVNDFFKGKTDISDDLQSYTQIMSDPKKFIKFLPKIQNIIATLEQKYSNSKGAEKEEIKNIKQQLNAVALKLANRINLISKENGKRNIIDVSKATQDLSQLTNANVDLYLNDKNVKLSDYEKDGTIDHLNQLKLMMNAPFVTAQTPNDGMESEKCKNFFKSRCENQIPKIKEIGQSLIDLSNPELRSKRPFQFIYGEPGSGKSTSVEGIADCLDIPRCKISADSVTSGSKENIISNLRKEIMKCLTGFKDQSKSVRNGLILFDDLHLILNSFKESKKEPAASNGNIINFDRGNEDSGTKLTAKDLRDSIFNLLKDLGDDSYKFFEIKDSDNKVIERFPINRVGFITTLNELPPEIDPNAGEQSNKALMSRSQIYESPYPTPECRKDLMNANFERFKKENQSVSESDMQKCELFKDEILKSDQKYYEDRNGRFGIRGFESFINKMNSYFVSNLSTIKKPCPTNITSNEIKDLVRNWFDSIYDYKGEPSPSLLKQKLVTTLNNFNEANRSDLEKISHSVKEVILKKIDKLKLLIKNHNADINQIQKELTLLETSVRQNIFKDKISFDKDNIKSNFENAMKGSLPNDDYTQIAVSLVSQILLKNTPLSSHDLFQNYTVTVPEGELLDSIFPKMAQFMNVEYCDLLNNSFAKLVSNNKSGLKQYKLKNNSQGQSFKVENAFLTYEYPIPKIEFTWDDKIKIYIGKNIDAYGEHKDDIYVWNKNGQSPKERIIKATEPEVNQLRSGSGSDANVKEIMKMILSSCFNDRKKNPLSTGIIAMKGIITDDTNISADKIVQALKDDIQKGLFKDSSGIYHDISKLTFVVIKENGQDSSKDQTQSYAQTSDDFPNFNIDPMSDGQRKEYLKSYLQQKASALKINADDNDNIILQKILEFHNQYEDSSKIHIPLLFTKKIIDEYIVNGLNVRARDTLGLLKTKKIDTDTTYNNIEKKYQQFIKNEEDKRKEEMKSNKREIEIGIGIDVENEEQTPKR